MKIKNVVIQRELDKKIKLLCALRSNVEWSGILFYNIVETDTEITYHCIDMSLLDVGTGNNASVYTEFEVNPNLAKDIADNIELADCYQGLIHSHNNMSTSPSGTDINTVKEMGAIMTVFLSLIVNNEGTYTALVSHRTKKTTNGITKTFKEINNEWVLIDELPAYDTIIEVGWEKVPILRETSNIESSLIERITSIEEEKREKAKALQTAKNMRDHLPYSYFPDDFDDNEFEFVDNDI